MHQKQMSVSYCSRSSALTLKTAYTDTLFAPSLCFLEHTTHITLVNTTTAGVTRLLLY